MCKAWITVLCDAIPCNVMRSIESSSEGRGWELNDWCFGWRDETGGIAVQMDCVRVRYVCICP
jgi:hypothetical protein